MPKFVRVLVCLFLVGGTVLIAAPSAQAAECNWGIFDPNYFQNENGAWIVQGGGYLVCSHVHDTIFVRVALENRFPGDPTWYRETDVTNTVHNTSYGQTITSRVAFPQPYQVDWRIKVLHTYACNGSCTTKQGDYWGKTDGLMLHVNLA
jgi:hypothetical protein